MKEYVLDTHAFAWWAQRPKRLGRRARRALSEVDTGNARAFIPAIVGIELTLLREAGRQLVTVADMEAATKRNAFVGVLALDLTQAEEFALLGALADPFDRMIVSAARATGRPLISADALIADSGLVDVIWD
ncbi:MAG: PIN domain-containing protein [Polyangiaceae bacterium]